MKQLLLPATNNNFQGHERRVGVELEFAGISAESICDSVVANFGGQVEQREPLLFVIKNSHYGDFIVELDSDPMKKLANELAKQVDSDLGRGLQQGVRQASEFLVPWELVTPPIPLSGLTKLQPLIDQLRKAGALGTRHASRFAFGLQLNPELPALDSRSICKYLKAYLCLQESLTAHEDMDLTRKISGYASAFDSDYVALVTHCDYWPELEQLIDDYLNYNPTRNRSLDLLPLFNYLDTRRVKKVVDDPRVKSRPTFHYRLPNCDIDSPSWNINHAWNGWLKVEALACDEHKLARICKACHRHHSLSHLPMNQRWQNFTQRVMGFSES